KPLEDIANPQPIASTAFAAAARAGMKGYVSVAVIDNGTDYTHPDLIQQIKFEVEGGKVVGAGYDVMGADRWPHPNLVRAQLFSFGAKEIREDHIFGAPADPIRTLKALNDKFVETLLTAMARTPALRGTLFQTKLNKENTTIFHMLPILEGGFDIKAYNERKKNGTLYNPSTTADPAKGFFPATVREIVTNSWAIDGQLMLYPIGKFYFPSIEGADVMYSLVEKVMKQFSAAYKWDQFFKTFETFFRKRQNTELKDAHQQLYEHWYNLYSGAASKDPRRDLASNFCKIIENEVFEKLADEKISPAVREKYVDAVIAKTLENMVALSKYTLKFSKDENSIKDAESFITAAPALTKIYKSYVSTPERL
ncbi:MAG: hypothetical protein K2P99_06835, partial [Burkholderiales bacterium]|nr:hypothetical protein [Burkholderiales bacterium]